ncbi:outer membrane lipoprotein-sorting protein [candidate division KSB1 bacterium]|nr:outer membrane lipoprotein-sorting protein [candidate division KSB1 bacterium]
MALVVSVLLVITGCSGLTAISPPAPLGPEELEKAAEVQRLLSALSDHNQLLKNFKGIGKIKVWQKDKLQFDERIAWIGSVPSKVSMAVLVSGFPVIKIASDGEYFYYYEVRNGRPYYKKLPTSDASLDQILSIQIKVSDILHLLAGRVPLRKHQSAALLDDNSGNGAVLELKNRWRGVIEKIFFDDTKSRVNQIEFLNRSGALIYRAKFEEMQTIQGYTIPLRLSISNDEGSHFLLDIVQYWVENTLAPSLFVLNPP